MDFSEFKRIRKELNLSTKKLSNLLGEKQVDLVKKWEKEKYIPNQAIQFIKKINENFTIMRKKTVEGLQIPENKNMFLFIYKNDADFSFYNHRWFKILLCNDIYFCFLSKVSDDLKKTGGRLLITHYNKNKYTTWLSKNGYSDCEQHQKEWGSSEFHYKIDFHQYVFMSQSLKSIKTNIKNLIKKVNINFKFSHDINTKIHIYINALIFGILDLAEDAIFLYKKNRLISSAAAVRCLVERQAILDYINQLFQECTSKDPSDLEDKLKKVIFGAKGEFIITENINILTILEKQAKNTLQDSRILWLYGELCNLVHPNFNGVWDSYVNVNIATFHTAIEHHDKGNIGLVIISGLDAGISLAAIAYESLSKKMEAKLLKITEGA